MVLMFLMKYNYASRKLFLYNYEKLFQFGFHFQIESLDTLVVFENRTEFHNAIRMVIDNVSFERNVTVQVFEATIR